MAYQLRRVHRLPSLQPHANKGTPHINAPGGACCANTQTRRASNHWTPPQYVWCSTNLSSRLRLPSLILASPARTCTTWPTHITSLT